MFSICDSRPPSPESPQPFVSFQPSTTLPFPTWDNTVAALNLENLPSFIRDYNSTNKSRLRIWFPTANKPHNGSLNTPVIAQFVIRDVVTIYLTLDYLPKDTTLVVESATAFGPQEKVCLTDFFPVALENDTFLYSIQKPPHSQSDYSVYQKLSQQLAKVIQAQPQVPFQLIMVRLAPSPTCSRDPEI